MKSILTLITLVFLFSCSNNSSNEELSPKGNYSLKTFKIKSSTGIELDLKSIGSDINLSLNGDKTFSGHLNIAISGADNNTNGDFSGTYTISGNKITFNTKTDTFLRDKTWELNNRVLSSNETKDGVTLTCELIKE